MSKDLEVYKTYSPCPFYPSHIASLIDCNTSHLHSTDTLLKRLYLFLQRDVSIVSCVGRPTFVRKPSESKSIFFMIDFSLLCCSSGESLTYSSTSFLWEVSDIQGGSHYYQEGKNGGENRAIRDLPCGGLGVTHICSPRALPPMIPPVILPLVGE